MAKQILNIGSSANDGTGTTLRAGGDIINDNFNEIYTTFGDGTNLTSQSIPSKIGGTNFTGSLIIGHSNTGTLSNADRNVAVGINAMDAIRTGDDNVFVGHNAGTKTTTGTINTGIGSDVLFQNLVGQNNVAVGYQSLYNNTGNFNTAIGRMSGRNITSGSGNVIIGEVDAASATGDRQLKIAGYDGTTRTTWLSGDSAGLLTIAGGEIIPGKKEGTNFSHSLLIGHSTTGTLSNANSNTGVGIEALDNLSAGDFNTALGNQAVSSVSTTRCNTGIGYFALRNTSGNSNTALGSNALTGTYAGSNNTAVGDNALSANNTGDNNTALGLNSGKLITGNSANYNLTLGTESGDNLTTGGGNVIIGSTDAASATGDRQLKIAGYDGSTTTTWISGDSSGALTFGNNVTVSGNLTVNGTTTTVNSTNTTLDDNLLELNSGAGSNANDSGIIIERGSTGDNAIIMWDESADKFTLGTTTGTADSTGNISVTVGELVANINGSNSTLTNVPNTALVGNGAFTITGDTGSSSKALGETIAFAGGQSITTVSNAGTITMSVTAGSIRSTELASASTLLILDSSGSTLKTIIGAGS